MEAITLPTKLENLKIIPLGGLGEIGMNCMILEYLEEILVIDCGLLFSDLDHFGIEIAIPDFTYLLERADKIKAIIMTHGHEDHIGALPFAMKAGIRVPVYCSSFTGLLIKEKLKEDGLDAVVDLRIFKMEETFRFQHFQITPVSVNHSIVDSAALFIQTPVGKIIHTGDFKIDPTPYYGQMMNLDHFKKAGDEGVLLLLSDSTNVERHSHSLSEKIIYRKFEELFSQAEGLVVVAMFASNVARMGQVLELAKKTGKKVALSGRTMEQNVRLGQEAGFLSGANSVLIPASDIEKYERDKILILSTGSQAEPRSALIRISLGEHGQIKLQKNDLVVMSSKFIPGNEKSIGKMINNLFRQGAEVLYEAVHDIHVSGHANRPELELMIKAVQPRFFIPIHGEYRHLVHHGKLASEVGMTSEQICIAVNGDILDLTADNLTVAAHLEEHRILIENRAGNEISKMVLKARRQLGESGVVFTLLTRSRESGEMISSPEIITKGVCHEDQEPQVIRASLEIVKQTLLDHNLKMKTGKVEHDLPETLRINLRRFFNHTIGKKPTVIPIVLNI